MCTAATYKTDGFYFGRTLDYEFSYGDEIAVMPRAYPLAFSGGAALGRHYALIGMAHIADGCPLWYDAMNEKGLCMAGLNFVESAAYAAPRRDAHDIAQYELISWVLAQCASVAEARALLAGTNLTGTPFSPQLPAARLHWMLADADECVVLEPAADGLHIYDNPAGVLTNEPSFPQQLFRLNDYAALSPRAPENTFAPALALRAYSRGMGALGLPGDISSVSRFVRAAFTRAHAVSGASEEESVGQFFHILGAVEQVRGCCELAPGEYEITLYTSCCSAQRGIYYYTTYGNRRISAVDMHRCDLGGSALFRFAPRTAEDIFFQT